MLPLAQLATDVGNHSKTEQSRIVMSLILGIGLVLIIVVLLINEEAFVLAGN